VPKYKNTVRDMLGIEFDAAADFPADDVGYGSTITAMSLSASAAVNGKIPGSAEQIGKKAIVTKSPGDKKSGYPESHRRILFVRPGADLSPEAAAEKILNRLATRAYRRPSDGRNLRGF